MQPYFLPYLGYVSLIKHTDKFILFDTVQFIRHGWIERNRILNPKSGWQYIQVPLIKESSNTLIKDVKINNELDWKQKIFAQLQHYKKRAPNYKVTVELLKDIFSENFNDIVSLDQISLTKVCRYLGIEKDIQVFSQMGLEVKPARAPDEWALNICKAIDIDEYWNPPGGLTFFDREKYKNANIDLKFHSIKLTEYDQKQTSCELGLSIVDVMMFNDVSAINELLDNYEFL